MREDFPQLAPANSNGDSRPRRLFGLDAEALATFMVERANRRGVEFN